MRSRALPGLLLGVLLLCAEDAHARQVVPSPPPADTIPLRDLPRDIARSIVDFLNAPETIQLGGTFRLPAGATIAGDVAVFGGPVTIAGRVEGDLVVLDGDLELLEGATVDGDVTVVGGSLVGANRASVGGSITTYSQRLAVRRQDGRLHFTPEDEPSVLQDPNGAEPRRFARTDLIIATGGGYNRVEGLPISVGPIIETTGPRPFRLRAEAIYRTEAGATLDPDEMGYRIRADQALASGGVIRIGATAYSVIDPIEDWHLETLENSLSTFLLHRDFRDHYRRRGAGAYLMLRPPQRPWAFRVEARSERHRSVPSGSPWTVFRNQELWRPQPLVAEGTLNSVRAEANYDTRSSSFDPANGWLVNGSLERSFRSTLEDRPRVPVQTPLGDHVSELPTLNYPRFTHAKVEVRRYNRLSPEARLNFRVRVAGALDGSSLPPQRQHALGGEGSLPGYTLFRLDCGARSARVIAGTEPPATLIGDQPSTYFPAYGCDRTVLGQVEYRGKLNLRLGLSDGFWGEAGRALDLGWTASPDWVAFLGAARGWSRIRDDEELALDFGTGILFHRLGIYAALPLRGEGGVNFFVRLGPRF